MFQVLKLIFQVLKYIFQDLKHKKHFDRKNFKLPKKTRKNRQKQTLTS